MARGLAADDDATNALSPDALSATTTLPDGGSASSTTTALTPSTNTEAAGESGDVSLEVVLSLKTTGATLHDLQRALTGLRSLVGDMEIELTARGTAATLDGIDKARFQNAVRQHLEESGIDFSEEWPR